MKIGGELLSDLDLSDQKKCVGGGDECVVTVLPTLITLVIDDGNAGCENEVLHPQHSQTTRGTDVVSCKSGAKTGPPPRPTSIASSDVQVEVVSDDVDDIEFASTAAKSRSIANDLDAFYCVNLSRVVERYQRWCELLPSITPYYAVKCNDDAMIISLLHELGAGFDCASKGELERVQSICQPSRPDDSTDSHSRQVNVKVIYANPCKQSSHIKFATSRVDPKMLMTFDNDTELYKISGIAPQARLVLRIWVDDSGSQCELSVKFGCKVGARTRQLLLTAKSLNLTVIGVSFHCGSGCNDASKFRSSISACRQVFDEAYEVGYTDMYLLDIGGGFPGLDEQAGQFEQMCDVIRSSITEYFGDSYSLPTGLNDGGSVAVTAVRREVGPGAGVQLEVIGEPGRYLVTSSHTLCTNVIAKRSRPPEPLEGGEEVSMYYINDGVYGSFNSILYDHMIPRPPHVVNTDTDTDTDKEVEVCSIWGPTCDGLDCIMSECHLSSTRPPSVNDWLIFPNMGAYTLSGASAAFNGFTPTNTPHYYMTYTDRYQHRP